MSMLIAALMFVVLLAIALAYFLWSTGRTWPLRNEELLVKATTGRPGRTKMAPRWTSFLVAVAVLAAGIVALALADHTGGGIGLTVAGVLLGLLFLCRGIAGYTPAWRSTFSAEPFASLDRKNYSPLALALGAGFLALVVMRLI
jgi:hypothetical protein